MRICQLRYRRMLVGMRASLLLREKRGRSWRMEHLQVLVVGHRSHRQVHVLGGKDVTPVRDPDSLGQQPITAAFESFECDPNQTPTHHETKIPGATRLP